MSFAWTEAFKTKAERLYVAELQPPTTVARCVGSGCSAADVLALAAALGWVRALKRTFWSAEEIEAVRAAYVDRGLAPRVVADELGPPWTAVKVRTLAATKGWSAARPPKVTAAIKRAVLAEARQAAAAGRAASPNMKPPPGRMRPPPPPVSREVAPDLRAAIDAAIAGGKVTVLPSGRAAGLSALESRFWAAMPAPAPGQSWGRR